MCGWLGRCPPRRECGLQTYCSCAAVREMNTTCAVWALYKHAAPLHLAPHLYAYLHAHYSNQSYLTSYTREWQDGRAWIAAKAPSFVDQCHGLMHYPPVGCRRGVAG